MDFFLQLGPEHRTANRQKQFEKNRNFVKKLFEKNLSRMIEIERKANIQTLEFSISAL